jgi:hypothetical protein
VSQIRLEPVPSILHTKFTFKKITLLEAQSFFKNIVTIKLEIFSTLYRCPDDAAYLPSPGVGGVVAKQLVQNSNFKGTHKSEKVWLLGQFKFSLHISIKKCFNEKFPKALRKIGKAYKSSSSKLLFSHRKSNLNV